MKYNRNYLISRKHPKAESMGVRAYSYRACPVMESREMLDGVMTHVVSFRKEDCARYLSQEEIFGILETLGMRKDASLTLEEPASGHALYYAQPAA